MKSIAEPIERSICYYSKNPTKFTVGKSYKQYSNNTSPPPFSKGYWTFNNNGVSQDTYFNWDHFTKQDHSALFTQAKSLTEMRSWIRPVGQFFKFVCPETILQIGYMDFLELVYKPLNGTIGQIIEHAKIGDNDYMTKGKVLFYNFDYDKYMKQDRHFTHAIQETPEGHTAWISYYDLRPSITLSDKEVKVLLSTKQFDL